MVKKMVTAKKKEKVLVEEMTADDLVGANPRQDQRGAGRNFDGVVDNRLIPDAGVPTQFLEGVLDSTPEGYGYLRPNFSPSDKDVYISASQIRRFNLRPGDMVGGQVREPKEKERYFGLLRV